MKDFDLCFSEGQAITATAASTNYLNTDVVINLGYLHQVEVNVIQAFDAGTLTVAVQVDDNSSFSSPRTLATTGSIGFASLTAGTQILIPVPFNNVPAEHFMRLNYTVTGSPTTGSVWAHYGRNPQTNRSAN